MKDQDLNRREAALRMLGLLGISAAGSLPFSLTGCAPEEGLEGTNPDENAAPAFEEVTDVSHTAVKRQSIGNCWSYAAAGWVESLHKARTGMDINISESWITFWDWHEKITGYGNITTNAMTMRAELETGGWWDGAMNTLRNRGVVYEAEFIPEEATAERSTRQSTALAAINNALNAGGALATSQARSDKALVLRTLFDAWQLSESVRAEILRVFGPDASKTVYTTSQRSLGFFRKVGTIPVKTALVRDGTVRTYSATLADVIPGGRYAWRAASYPYSASSRTDFLRRVMKALNAKQPVIISWLVDFAAMSSRGTFELAMPLAMPGRQGGHLTVLEDYQVSIQEPGQQPRTLRAGEQASAADMALAERYGIVEFLRIKNSWGTASDPSGSGFFGGYHDLYLNYLNGPIKWTAASNSDRTPLSSVTLPPGF